MRGETAKRILVAIPWIVFAIAIVVAGGAYFAVAMIGIGILCLREFNTMAAALRPIQRAGYVAVPALIVTHLNAPRRKQRWNSCRMAWWSGSAPARQRRSRSRH